MIQNNVNSFLALIPLRVPSLISSPSEDDTEITKDSALLYFPLDERLPIAMIHDMCIGKLDLLQLYFAIHKTTRGIQHCCLFTRPEKNNLMYKINLASDSIGFVKGLTVTIFDSGSPEVFYQALEDDLMAHSSTFNFEHSMKPGDALALFCKFL